MVDVIISVYGKPYHTLCTLKSLLEQSGEHIDKIYLIEEKQQPYGDSIKFIYQYFGDRLVTYIPNEYKLQYDKTPTDKFAIRYQYGFENSDKKYVFITHNDVLYTKDIVSDMLSGIGESVGIGLIGMCWNCPAYLLHECDNTRVQDYKPTYEEVLRLNSINTGSNRTLSHLDKEHPYPLPECRLNEFACLVNKEITNMECENGTPYFGLNAGADTACGWFKSLFLKGYKFKQYDISQSCHHGYWANTAGHPISLNETKYKEAELNAKNYFNENFNK